LDFGVDLKYASFVASGLYSFEADVDNFQTSSNRHSLLLRIGLGIEASVVHSYRSLEIIVLLHLYKENIIKTIQNKQNPLTNKEILILEFP
jgi:hypothetical protein